jgi:SpoVK/Ycf46/Vps4 family AAA+-type ATPase
LGEPFDEFFKNNPEDKQRVSKFFEFPDPETKELSGILEKKLREKNFIFDPALGDLFTAYIEERRYDPRCEHRNGWLVEKDIVPAIEKNQEERLSRQDSLSGDDYKTILEADIPLKNKKRTVDEILADLDAMIGLADVKKAVREIAQTIKMQKEREDKGLKVQGQAIHIVFTGNPGTGKTTVTRRLGQLFHAMGLLRSEKIVETDRAGMVGQYTGSTAPLVNQVCDKAMDGVLFIDEAYTLSGGKEGETDSFGQEAIDALLKRMEDDRGKFVVIAAGYKEEMTRFVQSNPGLKSRFTHFLHLEDYSPEELFAIFESMIKQNGYEIAADAEEMAKEAIGEMHRNRGKDFANGRAMRNLFDGTIRKMGTRMAALARDERTEKALTLITAADIPWERKKTLSVEAILAELDAISSLNRRSSKSFKNV